ncbi:ROK family transcriptional regulator [Treponema primitia]|uniref:ROK family transcriptional regulator n=1 Tax=Treponema primitia TaxID=88058 RepID=UPI000C1FD315|nr:ROK family transcriptional regulator [Treponema primitia]
MKDKQVSTKFLPHSANLSIQRMNRRNIYQLFRRERGLTRQDVVNHLRLSLPTVVQNINKLQDEGYIHEEGSVGYTGGRRAKTYSMVNNARIAIGLDITRDYIIAVAVDLTGEVIYRNQVWYKFERSDRYYKYLGTVVNDLVKKNSLDEKRILGVGLGVPGLVTEDNQTVFYGEILKFTGATCQEFSKYIPYKSALLNDANAAGFGEFWIRENPGSAFYVSLSNNIGGIVIINDRILTGSHFHSGEIGHLTLYPNGKPCYCGQKGCVDPYLAATNLSSLSNGKLADFFQLLEEKNPNAVKIWDTYLNDLALTLNDIQSLFDGKVILGGYVAEYIDKFIPELKKRTTLLNSFEKDADYIDICRYKTYSIAAGAALHFISEFIDSI